MYYNIIDEDNLFKMRGYKVLHPALELGSILYKLSQILFTVLVLHWAFSESKGFAALVTVVALIIWTYKLNWSSNWN